MVTIRYQPWSHDTIYVHQSIERTPQARDSKPENAKPHVDDRMLYLTVHPSAHTPSTIDV